MMNRRAFLRLLPGLVAVSFAATPAHASTSSAQVGQEQYGQPPVSEPVELTMEQVSRELATHKMQIGVGISMIRAITIDNRKIWKHLGNPGPHAERLENT
jgi:hypothetical protein